MNIQNKIKTERCGIHEVWLEKNVGRLKTTYEQDTC